VFFIGEAAPLLPVSSFELIAGQTACEAAPAICIPVCFHHPFSFLFIS
jgi:hypothetical protein